MPKERIRSSDRNSFGDFMVSWSKLGDSDSELENIVEGWEKTHVQVFPTARNDAPSQGGHFAFYSDDEESYISPVSFRLDRVQINRLIQVLRKARDQAYGEDA